MHLKMIHFLDRDRTQETSAIEDPAGCTDLSYSDCCGSFSLELSSEHCTHEKRYPAMQLTSCRGRSKGISDGLRCAPALFVRMCRYERHERVHCGHEMHPESDMLPLMELQRTISEGSIVAVRIALPCLHITPATGIEHMLNSSC